MTRRSLPVLVEAAISESSVARQQLLRPFEDAVRVNGVSCSKGCHDCCYHPVLLSVFEGVQLYRWLVERGMWSTKLRQAMEEHQEATWGLAIDVWVLSMRPCPLLKDGLCSAYEARPLSCRATFSVGDPHYCHPHRLGEGPTLIPRRELYDKVAAAEAPILRRHGLKYARVPLSVAVLLGERVDKGDLELGDAYDHLAEQTVKQGI